MIGVRAGVAELRLDLGSVHDARVAVRRLRATLTVFAPLLDPVPEGLGADLRWFAREVGGTRDAEVIAARVEDRLAGAPDRPAAELVAAALRRRAQAAEETARNALDHPRTGQLLAGLGRLHLDAPAAGEIYHDVRAHFLVMEALETLCVALPAAVIEASTPGVSTARGARLLHRQRKQVKTVRAVTALLETTSQDRSRQNKALRQVQELLGDHHDAVVTRSWVAEVADAATVARALAREIRRSERAAMAAVEHQLPAAVDRLIARADGIRRGSA